MREALGLDYSRSRCPAEQVCLNDQVPASGPDSIVFPDIVIRMRGAATASLSSGPPPMKIVEVMVPLEISIHGVTKDISAPIRLQLIGRGALQAETEFDVRLSDFGVVVKMPALLRVDEHASVRLRLLLRSQ